MPAGYNSWAHDRNEDMVQFHLASIHSQLAQASIGMAMAVAFRRAFISPKVCACRQANRVQALDACFRHTDISCSLVLFVALWHIMAPCGGV
jgi:hypothetical protein